MSGSAGTTSEIGVVFPYAQSAFVDALPQLPNELLAIIFHYSLRTGAP